MSVHYDERVIVQFAERLYRRASYIIAQYVVVGALVGAVVVHGAAYATHTDWQPRVLTALIAGTGALLGWLAGTERAFGLRFAAQTALCQVQIERNTKRAIIHAVPSGPAARGSAAPPPLPINR